MTELAAALGVDALDGDQLDELVAWATQRAAALAVELHDDPELGPLLRPNGHAPAPRPVEPPREPEAAVRTDAAREDSRPNLPLPPIPSAQPGYESPVSAASEEDDAEELEELEEVELLDEDDVELVEESLRARAPERDEVPEWKAALATAQEGDETAAEAKAKNRTEDSALMRLRAEEEALREHDVDLSDLDES